MPKHTHLYRPYGWVLLTSPADYEGWQRVVLQGKCTVCGDVAVLAGEQNTRTMQSRMLEAGRMTCRRRTFWLCTACRRCRRYTSLHAAWGRFWCAYCQAVQVFKPLPPMPQMARYARSLLEETTP